MRLRLRLNSGNAPAFSLLVMCLLALINVTPASAAFTPAIATGTRDNIIKDMIYFEDSPVMIYHERDSGLLFRSEDDGATFEKVTAFRTVGIHYLIPHPYNHDVVYALSNKLSHWRSDDKGATWRQFTTPKPVTRAFNPLSFHASKPEYVLVAANDCKTDDLDCQHTYYYTVDNFRSNLPRKLTSAHKCIFAKAHPSFDPKYMDTIVCIQNSPDDANDNDITNRVVVASSDFFQSSDYLVADGGLISNPIDITAVESFLIIDGKRFGKKEGLCMFVSKDGYAWDLVEFPHESNFREQSYTILQSTPNSLQVDILLEGTDENPVGQSFASNSNGSYFTRILDNTNRDPSGLVDYEKITGLDGVALANIVQNADDITAGKANTKQIRSQISFNDGRSWSYLKVTGSASCGGDEKCSLNLHSVTDNVNVGRVFSSPAPGILLGVGNTGDALKSYEEGDLYYSDNAGATWTKALDGPHLYEVGDQGNFFVAIKDGEFTKEFSYSKDRGRTWVKATLPSEIEPTLLTTTYDSTSLKFFIVGLNKQNTYTTFSVNFEGVYPKKCGKDDFEGWYPRYDEKADPICVMGHQQKFTRRKATANCVVGELYKEPVAEIKSCPCTEQDYECDFNYIRNKAGDCVSVVELPDPKEVCEKGVFQYEINSGYRLIPGNTCSKKDGVVLDQSKVYRCEDDSEVPDTSNEPDDVDTGDHSISNGDTDSAKEDEVDGAIKSFSFTYPGHVAEYYYLGRSEDESSSNDETIILRTDQLKAYVTHDQGTTWSLVETSEDILHIYPNPYVADHVYLICSRDVVLYSTNRAKDWSKFRTPAPANTEGLRILQFHKTLTRSLIWTGEEGCEKGKQSLQCRTTTYYSTTRGERWRPLLERAGKCDWVGNLQKPTPRSLIYCEKYADHLNNYEKRLVYSDDYFKTQHMALDEVIGFVQMEGYLIAATVDHDGKSLKPHVSVDGITWSQAYFPEGFQADKQQAYTVLSAKTKAIKLHVTTSTREGGEFGTMFKSNSNGTFYVTSLEAVNRDSNGYVDFEELIGLEGVILVNIVANPSDVRQGSLKKLRTMISHNDGGEWNYVSPPTVDSEGNKYSCSSKGLDECSLNLHGFTERADYRDTFSSQSAVGMMLGIGNVGNELSPLYDGDTFFTRDGGMTWKEVKKGVYQWEYGDQGSIVVIVNDKDNTNVVYYTLDEGDTWKEFKFNDEPVRVNDIATIPTDNSRKFLLLCTAPMSQGQKSMAIQLDFTDVFPRKCVLDLEHPDKDDFELWTPSHPYQAGNCLFGHEAQYQRKIKGRDCYVGDVLLEPYKIVRNCPCTRQDYECDFNYVRAADGTCKLVPGYTPPDTSEICSSQSNVFEYYAPTGYRKIPLSTCEGGQEFDKGTAIPCPGKEEEFFESHNGLRGFGLAVVIILPIVFVAIISYVIYHQYHGKFGQIRLGDEDPFANETGFNRAVGVVATTVYTGIMVTSQFFRGITNTVKFKILKLFGRDSMPTRSAYVPVDAEEGELFGVDDTESEEEGEEEL